MRCCRHTVTVWQTTVWILTTVQYWNISFLKLCVKLDSFSVLVVCLCVSCLWRSWTLGLPVQWAPLAILCWNRSPLISYLYMCSVALQWQFLKSGHRHIRGNLYLPTAILLNTSELLTLSLTFWHRSFTFNSNKSPTWCNNFSVYYPDVCLQLNMFRAFSRPSSGAQWLPLQSLSSWWWAGKRPETCWAVNKRHDNKIKNCCIRLVIYLNCTMMHGLTNLKFYI